MFIIFKIMRALYTSVYFYFFPLFGVFVPVIRFFSLLNFNKRFD